MRRPDRNLVLSLLAFGAAFAQGWQQEREARVAAQAATPSVVRAPPLAAARAMHAPRATAPVLATADYDPVALGALLDRLYDLDYAEWSAADIDALHALLAAGAPDVAELLVAHCRATHDCQRLGPALEERGAAGDIEAAVFLSELYTEPDFPGADPARAFEWLARYAELGDADAKQDAALRTLYGAPDDRPEWRERALGWLAAAAGSGSARATLELLKLTDGEGEDLGVAADPQAAAHWYDVLLHQADPQVLREAAIHYQSRGDAAGTTRAVELWIQQGDVGGAFGSNNAAWLLTVCGRGLEDFEHAWRLIQREHRDHGETWQSVDTLAGVQAQLGMFGDALVTQQRALDMLAAQGGDGSAAEAELQARFDGYAAQRVPVDPGLCPQPP
jgi:TPR repeat protein